MSERLAGPSPSTWPEGQDVTVLECPEGAGPDCDLSEEPCCDGCASGLGPCFGPGYHWVCLTHRTEERR